MKKLVISMCIGFFAAVSLTGFVGRTSADLDRGIVRLHVRANSNSHEDQELKLLVRDRLLVESSTMLCKATNAQTARSILAENLSTLRDAAEDEIQKQGYSYSIRLTLDKSSFPTREYHGVTLPAGSYNALVADIGRGEGDNWWCVMFPPLCFTRETIVKEADIPRGTLRENLGHETCSMLQEGEVSVKFKIYELLSSALGL